MTDPTLGQFADDGFRIHISCAAPNCRYGGRTYAAADVAAKHGRDVTLDQLRRRAVCGEGHRGRIVVEVSPTPPERPGGDLWGGT